MTRNQRILLAITILVVGLGVGLLLSPKLSHAPFENENPQLESVAISPETQAFKTALEVVLQKEFGTSTRGYEPEKLLHVFPSIKGEDFNGVEAVIGFYQFQNGTTTYTNNEITDATADDISLKGYDILRTNLYQRLGISTTTEPSVVVGLLRGEVPFEQEVTTACPLDAKICPDGSAVGREGKNCEFAACPVVTSKEVTCTKEQRGVNACIELYAPVCASVEVQCVTTPCNPVPQTFSNSCFACADEHVESYVEGECPIPVL